MAFQPKLDYCGLTAQNDKLIIRDSDLNGSVEKYQPQGEDGSYVTTEIYGETCAPSNNYGVAAGCESLDVQLGSYTEFDGKAYALESVNISTSAGAPVTVSASAQQIEDGVSGSVCMYEHVILPVSSKHHAQTFGAFTLSGEGCHLTSSSAAISATVTADKVAGSIISSDVSAGIVTVSGDILSVNGTIPVITPAEGWAITNVPAITESNPETEAKSYHFELQKILAKVTVEAE
jgi:hypothetical protein